VVTRVRDDGLVVIGVHTPEFSFEHDIDLVREAVQDRDIDSRSRLTTTTKSGLPSPTITGRRSSSPWTGTSASPSASTSATPGSKVAMGNASREFVGETESASWLGGVPSAHVVHAETDRAEVVQILRVTRRDE
jgi:hypothetical protein